MKRLLQAFLLALLLSAGAAGDETGFAAYSLREAASRARSGKVSDELMNLGGITRVAGLVYDRTENDVILFGAACPDLPSARLDDLVVAMRARMRYDEWPLVSIDPLSDSERTRLQRVRFSGHIENTAFGRDFLQCDILLKLYSLQLTKEIPSVRPYNAFVEEGIKAQVERSGAKLLSVHWYGAPDAAAATAPYEGKAVSVARCHQARFWFYAMEPYVYAYRGDVFCIKQLRLALQSEDDGVGDDPTAGQLPLRFCRQWTQHFDEVCRAYSAFTRLKVLYDLVAAAESIRSAGGQHWYLDYFLDRYSVASVPTPANYPLQEIYCSAQRTDGLTHLVKISGGVTLTTRMKFLNAGDVTQLRSIVKGSRPSADTLTWRLPLTGWKMPNPDGIPRESEGAPDAPMNNVRQEPSLKGCSVLLQSALVDPKAVGDGTTKRFFGFLPPPPPLPPLRGVSMKMVLSNGSFAPGDGETMDLLREMARRPSSSQNVLSWPAKTKGDKDVAE